MLKSGFNLITVGDAVIDTHIQIDDANLECDVEKRCKLCLPYGGKIPITDSFQSLGGNAANVAVAAAKLGLDTAIITTLGLDANSVLVKQELEKNDVVTDYVRLDAETRTRYSVILSYRGERTVLSFHNRRQYVWPGKMPATDWIYYTSVSEGFPSLQKRLIVYLKKNESVKLAFNPGSYQLEKASATVKEMIGLTDILFINREEAEKILGIKIKKDREVVLAAGELAALGAREVVLTDGENGAFAGQGKKLWHLDIYPEKVISKTGAGDAFSAGYLAARMSRLDIPAALMWGTANSAGVISRPGAQNGLLAKAKILAMIKKHAGIKPTLI